MSSTTYMQGEWRITVYKEGAGRRAHYHGQVSRPATGILDTSAYSTPDDAQQAAQDLIHLHECYEERWKDFCETVALGFDRAMSGDFNLTPLHQQRLDDVPSPGVYQTLRDIAAYDATEAVGAVLTRDDLMATILKLQAMARAAVPGLEAEQPAIEQVTT